MSQPYLPDLASRELGGSVVAATDELFAERENLIKAEAPVFRPHTFGPKGQLMDGWETRRRREPGVDHAIVRLGCPGVVRRIVIDTAFFTGNYPPAASVEACGVEGYPSPAELAGADWVPLVERSKLAGDTAHEFPVADEHRYTHVRLSIYPDGGVARLRVFGEVVADPRLLPRVFDLAALEHGARVLDCSNSFYSEPNNLLKPGLARVMGEGWETARRRDDGNDWVSLRLACAGRPVLAEIDTTHFVGNAPGWASLTGDGGTLLPRTRLQPDTRHRFALDAAEVTEVRLDIFPDGGVSRLRLHGTPTEAGRASLMLRFANALPDAQLAGLLGESAVRVRPYSEIDALPAALLRRPDDHALAAFNAEPDESRLRATLAACCAAPAWIDALLAGRPFADEEALCAASDAAIAKLTDADLAEALRAHPRIGDRPAGPQGEWSRQEQAGAASADATVRAELAEANAAYEQRFGQVYLVCATGRSAEELLAVCRSRLDNPAAVERAVVLGELAKISRLRLAKLLGQELVG